jgi:regulator of protease activity HflC (stomatin/prohibitin superfamily)
MAFLACVSLSVCAHPIESIPIQLQVFVQVGVAVQYRVLVNGAYDAYYRLTDPRNQIQSYVFDVVRSTVPRMDLDEAFVSKDEVGSAVLMQLRDVMKDYGYEINKTLVTDLSPDNRVKASMNEINASRRLKEGAFFNVQVSVVVNRIRMFRIGQNVRL